MLTQIWKYWVLYRCFIFLIKIPQPFDAAWRLIKYVNWKCLYSKKEKFVFNITIAIIQQRRLRRRLEINHGILYFISLPICVYFGICYWCSFFGQGFLISLTFKWKCVSRGQFGQLNHYDGVENYYRNTLLRQWISQQF